MLAIDNPDMTQIGIRTSIATATAFRALATFRKMTFGELLAELVDTHPDAALLHTMVAHFDPPSDSHNSTSEPQS